VINQISGSYLVIPQCQLLTNSRKLEILGGWRKLDNENLHDLYCSPNITRVIKSVSIKWAGHAARSREKKNEYRISVSEPKEKRPVGRSNSRWDDSIKIDIVS
jgi:hypothetical protein